MKFKKLFLPLFLIAFSEMLYSNDVVIHQSGAKVKIESGNVEVIGKFTAELGSKVEFTQSVDE